VNPAFKLKESKKEEKQESLPTEVAELAECFMNAAKSLHKLHLKITGQGSYAAHVALSGYDKFHDFADDLCEEYQSISENILNIPEKNSDILNSVEEGIIFLSSLKLKIDNLQKITPYSEINNLLDEVKSEINKIKYKLLFLK